MAGGVSVIFIHILADSSGMSRNSENQVWWLAVKCWCRRLRKQIKGDERMNNKTLRSALSTL